MSIPHEFLGHGASPSAIHHYRNVKYVHYTHVRKRCACNAVVTALQLSRFGCCEKCVRAA